MLDLLVIGAGPAGLSAAISAAESDLKVKVIDEFPEAGGRLVGQLYQKPDGEWWNGVELSAELRDAAVEAGAELQCGISVYDISKTEEFWVVHTDKEDFHSENLLLATGASEKALPLPGWTLPGVMSIGAAQVMSNVHRVKPGQDCIVIGANVLSISIAHELVMAGVNVKSIVIPKAGTLSGEAGVPEKVMASLMRLTHLAPSKILRTLGKAGRKMSPRFTVPFFPKQGIKMLGVRIKIKTAALEIIGDEEVIGVNTVEVDSKGNAIKGTEKFESADVVCIAGGLTPMVELASVAGTEFEYTASLGGHVPVHDDRMRTNVEGLYVAGNITGVESANVAMAQGTVAGYSVAYKRRPESSQLKILLEEAVQTVITTRSEALIEFEPGIAIDREKSYDRNLFNLEGKNEMNA